MKAAVLCENHLPLVVEQISPLGLISHGVVVDLFDVTAVVGPTQEGTGPVLCAGRLVRVNKSAVTKVDIKGHCAYSFVN